MHLEHWNGNVVILTKSSSLAALKVVKMTTFSAASDEDFVKATTFSFQWMGMVGNVNEIVLWLRIIPDDMGMYRILPVKLDFVEWEELNSAWVWKAKIFAERLTETNGCYRELWFFFISKHKDVTLRSCNSRWYVLLRDIVKSPPWQTTISNYIHGFYGM